MSTGYADLTTRMIHCRHFPARPRITMAASRHLKTLREIVRAHRSDGMPDLAALARDLGAAIHRHSGLLADELDALRRTDRFERWQVGAPLGDDTSVLIMTWPPGHATPVHDHAGLWGLEITLYGALEVENWRRETDGSLQLRHREWLGAGDATWFEDGDAGEGLHRCRNLSRHDTALSLHVYGGDLAEFAAYEQTRPDAWRMQRQSAAIAGRLSG
jgi:predicted metal-dependent enzyme (double-stranded beta helix superfamily)